MKEQAAREGVSPDATILEHLGDVYFHLHDLRKAAMPGARRRNMPNRPSPPSGACRRSARRSVRWSSLARYPSHRRPGHPE